MKQTIKYIVLLLGVSLLLTGCNKEETTVQTDAQKFKEEYESLNGKTNASGQEHRTVTINENNPFVYATAEEIVEKIKNGETFYVYFGDTQCPWCRSAIEKAIEVANEYKVEKIYYVRIWDDDHNEILRDKYVLDDNNKATLQSKGTDAYYELLDLLKDVLSDYTLSYTTSSGKTKTVSVGEKRIFAPNYIYVDKGEATDLVEGTSSEQTDSRETLTEEMLQDETEIFTEFFNREEE